MHKHCSGLNGRLDNVFNFKCRTCLNPTVANDDYKKVQFRNIEYKVVDLLCYLGDMLSACGGAEGSSVSHIRSGWKKLIELLSLLTSPVFSHKAKGKLYSACARGVMLNGGITLSLKESGISRIAQKDMQMVWRMCHASLRDKKSSKELQNRLGIANIMGVLHQTRPSRFRHVKRMDKENAVNNYRFIEVGSQRKVDHIKYGPN